MTSAMFPQTCSVYSFTDAIVGGEMTRTYAVVHENVPCYLFDAGGGIRAIDTRQSSESRLGETVVAVPATYTGVRDGYRVEITDPTLGTLGVYIVQSVRANRGISGTYSVSLSCKREA